MASVRTRFSATRSDGVRSVRVILTPDEVIVARQLAAEGYNVKEIAELIDANYNTVWGAIAGYTWRYLDQYAPPVRGGALPTESVSSEPSFRHQVVEGRGNTVPSDQIGPVHHKLTAEQVLAARAMLRADPRLGLSGAARQVGANMGGLVPAIRGETWTHLNSIEPPIPSLRSLRQEHRRVRATERANERLERRRLCNQKRLEKLDARQPKGNRIRAGLAAEIRHLAHEHKLDVYGFSHKHKVPIHVIYDVLNGRLWRELNSIVPPINSE